MPHDWKSTAVTTESETLDLLAELYGKRWLCRGQPRRYACLVPSIDREELKTLSRIEKLSLERQAIDLFRSTTRFFSHPGEQIAMADDFVALMVLRHYGVPTRLLDWSMSPYVAAYFACEDDSEDGEIWSFDHALYAKNGKEQWKSFPETTLDGNPENFRGELTAFTTEGPPDWFICAFYAGGFHRQNAQRGAYTVTARFGRDHAKAIARLLRDKSSYHLYVVPKALKCMLNVPPRAPRHLAWFNVSRLCWSRSNGSNGLQPGCTRAMRL
jgi:hypothetical protein